MTLLDILEYGVCVCGGRFEEQFGELVCSGCGLRVVMGDG